MAHMYLHMFIFVHEIITERFTIEGYPFITSKPYTITKKRYLIIYLSATYKYVFISFVIIISMHYRSFELHTKILFGTEKYFMHFYFLSKLYYIKNILTKIHTGCLKHVATNF